MYKVVKESDFARFENAVNDYIKRGYILQGGVSTVQGSPSRGGSYQWTSSSGSGSHTVYVNFIQAMYLPPKPAPEPDKPKTVVKD